MNSSKIGLVLCGGSLFGIYQHHAVVVALRNLGILPQVVLGASAGSIVGAFYTTGMSTEEMRQKMITLQADDFLDPMSKYQIFKELVFNHGSKFYGFIKGDKLENYVHSRISEKDDFSKTEIPYYVSATNLKTYKMILFSTGSISEKVRASAAVPMMFTPKKIDNQYYIDGAIKKDQLPKSLLSVHPDLDYIILSNASHDQESDDNSYIERAKIPMVEIARRTMSMQEKFSWPKKIGKTKIIYLTPGISTPVDIFNPSHEIANAIYQDSLKYSLYHLERYFKRVKRYTERKNSQIKPKTEEQNEGA